MLAIDANLVMFNLGFLPTHDLVLLLASLGLLERLSIVVDFLYQDQKASSEGSNMSSTYMNKALDLFLVFSKENCAEVNERLCGSEVMQMLLNLI